MHGSIEDIPVTFEAPNVTLRQIEWGGTTVEVGATRQDADPAPFFKGLPDDRCQCPHWGYVLKGRRRYRFADREEVYNAGEVYYAPPGHTPVSEAGCEYVEFSPTDLMRTTMEVIKSNMKARRSEEHPG